MLNWMIFLFLFFLDLWFQGRVKPKFKGNFGHFGSRIDIFDIFMMILVDDIGLTGLNLEEKEFGKWFFGSDY